MADIKATYMEWHNSLTPEQQNEANAELKKAFAMDPRVIDCMANAELVYAEIVQTGAGSFDANTAFQAMQRLIQRGDSTNPLATTFRKTAQVEFQPTPEVVKSPEIIAIETAAQKLRKSEERFAKDAARHRRNLSNQSHYTPDTDVEAAEARREDEHNQANRWFSEVMGTAEKAAKGELPERPVHRAQRLEISETTTAAEARDFIRKVPNADIKLFALRDPSWYHQLTALANSVAPWQPER